MNVNFEKFESLGRLSRRLALRFLLCAFLPLPVCAQTAHHAADARWREAGLPFMQTYSASEYGGDQQNWDIVQDRRGVMYFANQNCLLEYDGVSWRRVYTGNRLSVTSVDLDPKGRIWLGAALEIGYLAPDTLGNLQYTSLMAHVPARIREVANHWQVAVTSQGVYFQTRNVLLRWSERSHTMKTWNSESGFDSINAIEDELYIRKEGVGLMTMEGDSLQIVPGGERMADFAVSVLFPYSDSEQTADAASGQFADRTPEITDAVPRKQFLAVTSTHGLFVYDGTSFQHFKTRADAFLVQDNVLCGAALADGSYALGTRNSGLFVIGPQGNLRLILNMATGLPGSAIYQAYVDRQGGLWLGSNRGIVRVEIPSPFSLHMGAPALRSGTPKVLRHRGNLYAATAEGVYKMKRSPAPGAPPTFQAVAGLKAQVGDLLSSGSLFLAATSNGTYQIEDDRATQIQGRTTNTSVKDSPVFFLRSRYDTNRVYVGLRGGLALLELRAGRWQFTGQVPGIYERVQEIAEETPDVLWLTTRFGTATRIELPSLYLSLPSDFFTAKIERFGEAQGLARGWVGVRSFKGKILFPTNKGLRRFAPERRAFPLDSTFAGIFADTTWNIPGGKFFKIDKLERIWTSRFQNNQEEAGVATPEPNGSYIWHTTPLLRFADFGEIWDFFIDNKYDGVFWFSGADGIVRYDETIPKDYNAGYPALIRRAIVNGDSAIYGGAFTDPGSVMKPPVLPFDNNTVRFEYAAPGDLVAFLRGLVMSFQSLAERKQIELEFVLTEPGKDSAEVNATPAYFDRDKIEKIFTNLLANALKFTHPGGTVSVHCTPIAECRLHETTAEGQTFEVPHPRCAVCANIAASDNGETPRKPLNCMEITVADTGHGIPAEHLPHIFDRFYMVDSSSRRGHGGTGIGLALVKELVQRHYGSIVVNSEEGRGSAFTVCLPLGKSHLQPDQRIDTPATASESEQDANRPVVVPEIWDESVVAEPDRPSPTAKSAAAGHDRPRILLIEDNTDVRDYIHEQLQTNYTVLQAADGEEGVARAIEAIPDLIISDIMMPKMDGYEVCRTLKTDTRTSHIPIILLTAKAREEEKLAGLETGADVYLLKPFRQKELDVRVRKLIEVRRKLRAKYSSATTIKPTEIEATSIDRAFLSGVIAFVEANMDEEDLNVERIAAQTAMSVSQLNRKLNALIGQSAGRLLRSMRLQRAADLLEKKSGNVAEICYAVGFGDQANFARAFKKQFGCSPSKYQKAHQE